MTLSEPLRAPSPATTASSWWSGPAGAGKTNMLEAAVADLHDQRPPRPRAGADGTSCVGVEAGDRGGE